MAEAALDINWVIWQGQSDNTVLAAIIIIITEMQKAPDMANISVFFSKVVLICKLHRNRNRNCEPCAIWHLRSQDSVISTLQVLVDEFY